MTIAFRIPANFKRIYKKKPRQFRDAIDQCIARLTENPRHPGLNTHKMRGVKHTLDNGRKVDVWEAYVDTGNRVTFHYEESELIVLRNNCNHDMLRRSP